MPELYEREQPEFDNEFVEKFRRFMDCNPGLTFEEARLAVLRGLVRDMARLEQLLFECREIF